MGRVIEERVGVHSAVSKPARWVRRVEADYRDKLRYEFDHSILSYEDSEWDGEKLGPGHRLSIMVRVSLILPVSPLLMIRTPLPDQLDYKSILTIFALDTT